MTTTRIDTSFSPSGGNSNGNSFIQGGFGQPGQPPVLTGLPFGTPGTKIYDSFYPYWLRGPLYGSLVAPGYAQPPSVPPITPPLPGLPGPYAPGGSGPGHVLGTGTGSSEDLFVFASGANNLTAASDTNGVYDVYLKNQFTGTTTPVSLTRFDGSQSKEASYNPVISNDGKWIAYQSHDTGIVANQGGSGVPEDPTAGLDSDVFLYNVANGSQILVSRRALDGASTGAGPGFSIANFLPAINSDGSAVAFVSTAAQSNPNQAFSNQVVGDTSDDDVFVFNRLTGTVTQASVVTNFGTGTAINTTGNAENPDISSNGNLVVFDYAPLVAPGDRLTADAVAANQREIYVRDLASNTTTLISKRSTGTVSTDVDTAPLTGGAATGQPAGSYNPSISPNGRYIAYASNHQNLVSIPGNGGVDIYLYDSTLGNAGLKRVSVATDGSQAEVGSNSWNPSVDDNGTVTFTSDASNLVAGDTNGVPDVFTRTLAGVTTLISVASGGAEGNQYSDNGSSGNVATAFDSNATNLVPSDTNGNTDVFINKAAIPGGGGGGGGLPPTGTPLIKADFNGNSTNDILFQERDGVSPTGNPQKARTYYFDPSEGPSGTFHVFTPLINTPGLRLSAVGNFDNDPNTELLYYDETTGSSKGLNYLYDTVARSWSILTDPLNPAASLRTPGLQPTTAVDANGDGIDEIVFHNVSNTGPGYVLGQNFLYDPVTAKFTLLNVTTDTPLAGGSFDASNHPEIVYGDPVSGDYRVYDLTLQSFHELFADPNQTAPGFVATGALNVDKNLPDLVLFQNTANDQTVGYNPSNGAFGTVFATTPGWQSKA